VKWVPGKTNIAASMPEGRKSVGGHADEILQTAVDRYNEKVELPGLRLGDVGKRGGPGAMQDLRPSMRTRNFDFPDASGRTWSVPVPVDQNGNILAVNSCLPVPGMEQKLTFKPDTKRGSDNPPRIP
jgi:hypothetical protein